MNIKYGGGKTEYGPGVSISLTGEDVARYILAGLVAHGVHIFGPRTITVNGELCSAGHVYVDPGGSVVTPDGDSMSGRGPEKSKAAKSKIPLPGPPWLPPNTAPKNGDRILMNEKDYGPVLALWSHGEWIAECPASGSELLTGLEPLGWLPVPATSPRDEEED